MTTDWHLNHARFGTKPWAVQVEAMRRSAPHRKYALFAEQGLGKTAMAQNAFIDDDDTDVHLVLCPNSFKNDWVLAPEEWGVGWMPVGMWPRNPIPTNEEYIQYAINFESARKSKLNDLLRLCEKRRVRLTIDESAILANPGTESTKGMIEIAKRADRVWLLNGTPLIKNPVDYFGQLRAIGRLNGWNATNFKNRFAVTGGWKGKQLLNEIKNETELATILDECSFRALKADWRKDLPPKVRTPIHLEMSAKQRVHYDEMMDEFYTMVDGEEITAQLVLTQMDKLRQISSCVLMKDGNEYFFEEDKNNPKLQALYDIVSSCPGKIIVVYNYKASGTLLRESLTKKGLKPAYIKGGMKPEELSRQKDMFNNDPDCRAIVCQELASCRGHTLIGQTGKDRCATMYFYENSFSYYQRAQMEDRNHRGEQDETCNIYDPVVSPMDALTVEILTNKKDMADGLDQVVAKIRELRG